MTTEIWRPVPAPGYEGYYEASNLGRIRSRERRAANGRLWPSVVLRGSLNPNGHYQVVLSRDNAKRTQWVHRLILLAFHGDPPEGTEALHRDGDPKNNRIENLEWGTRSENALDQVRHGVHFCAAKTHCPHGHPYSKENTYHEPGAVHRKCRTCMRAQAKRTNVRRKAMRASQRRAA